MKSPALIFDFGNVVAFFDYGRSCERLVGELDLATTGAELIESLRSGGLGPLVARLERGEVADESFLDDLIGLLGVPATRDQVRRAWSDIFWLNEPVAELVGELDERGYTLVLGSNTNAIHATGFLETFAPTFRHFDGIVLSYQLGHAKPSAEFYLECARVAGRAPRDCLFIDDLAENVVGARAAGLDGIIYLDPGDLRDRLRERGVEV